MKRIRLAGSIAAVAVMGLAISAQTPATRKKLLVIGEEKGTRTPRPQPRGTEQAGGGEPVDERRNAESNRPSRGRSPTEVVRADQHGHEDDRAERERGAATTRCVLHARLRRLRLPGRAADGKGAVRAILRRRAACGGCGHGRGLNGRAGDNGPGDDCQKHDCTKASARTRTFGGYAGSRCL